MPQLPMITNLMRPGGKLMLALLLASLATALPRSQVQHNTYKITTGNFAFFALNPNLLPVSPSPVKTPANHFEALALPKTTPHPAKTLSVPIFMFHHAGNAPPGADPVRRDLTVSAADLDAQMKYLKSAGYHPITQTQLFKALFMGGGLPSKPVLITFDDGYLDNFSQALPILVKYGFPATFYIISGRVGGRGYLSWEQIKVMEKDGMDIGSHTVNHQDLSIVSAADLKHELGDSAKDIGAHLGHPVYWFCYPSGRFNARVLQVENEDGYLLAATEKWGRKQSSDAPLALSRYRIRNTTGLEGFKNILQLS